LIEESRAKAASVQIFMAPTDPDPEHLRNVMEINYQLHAKPAARRYGVRFWARHPDILFAELHEYN
jgi:hypothetical protein